MVMHREFLQTLMYQFSGTATGADIFDVPMPRCNPKEICLIQGVRIAWDMTANDIQWRLILSLEPKDQFTKRDVFRHLDTDWFYYLRVINDLNTEGMADRTRVDQIIFPLPFAYPYKNLRAFTNTTNGSAGYDWWIQIFYTIEALDKRQLTAITVRRGTVRHAREQGPEP